ncbi:glycosyltransferase family 2 protein [Octadecabacter sp. 1_MG-2023]|uniref:glycosyltransferase family 2 protein n=1 Tax=unclassified Octadecabacter TaxID=196158 RepID=UPI001C093D27|nr:MULTISPECIES: glycosyltransferase family 2 protein [unclassified Octadecabacter]MBU2994047.1 glycosyltransferase family 2 protein [Octadecabacter sp. B2R22]MDO6736099.1 glycosyltransferase family 2 protein [Octadecabacter sp. 1_MG-2023]
MTANLAISIINYRTADMTIAAVQSVLDTLLARPARIVIVDNASGDGSADAIADWITRTADPRVQLVRSATNSGFAGGHNQGMAAAPDADFYLILNSDALLRADFFDPLLAAAEQNPDVGLIAPQLEWEDGTPQISCFRFANIASELMRGAQTGPVTSLLKRYVHALDLPPDPDQIEWCSFACILLRGDMVRQIGPMDEGYFLYYEDSEYGLRARRAGWGVRYVPQARAVHFRGGSGPVKSAQSTHKRLPPYFWRSRTRFLRQHHGPLGPLLANLGWNFGRGIAWLRVLTGRGVPKTADCEWRDIWTGFLTPLKPDEAPQ